jgi:hypothetical protein
MKPSRFLLAIALCATSSVIAQEYKIQMQRTAKEGQQFELSCRLQETRRDSATFSGRSSPEQKTNFVAELDALIKVLETDSKGRITKASCTISNCVRVEDQQKRELLPRQAVVLASAGTGNSQFLVNGKPLDPETQKVVAIGMQLSAEDPFTEDIFGTDRPKKIGESWDINPEYLAGVLKPQKLGITKRNIEGRTTLEQLVKVKGVDCLELASKVYLKNFMPPLPPGVQVKQAFGALRLSGKFPLDISMAALEEVMDFDFSFIAQADEGPNAGVTTKMASTLKCTLQRKYLK